MACETKATVAMDSLTIAEAEEIARLFGLEPRSVERLYGGFSSSNFKVACRPLKRRRTSEGAGGAEAAEAVAAATYLLKINYHQHSIEDLEHQIFVMNHLRPHGFPTNYPHATPDGSFLVESNGRRAMLLDFIHDGTPGQLVLERDEAKAGPLLTDLGTALAQLHQVSWPKEPALRDLFCGFPVCGTGDLLRGEELATLKADARFADHPFVAYMGECMDWLRELYQRELPQGLIHGDAFLDNTLYADDPAGSGSCSLLALVDWEDSCVGPLALDLAVCAHASCFTASNDFVAERFTVLLREYEAKRPLSPAERGSLVDFMAASALACGFYRFCEFNVRRPDSDIQAKDSYKIMFDRAQRLHDGAAGDEVAAVLGLPSAE